MAQHDASQSIILHNICVAHCEYYVSIIHGQVIRMVFNSQVKNWLQNFNFVSVKALC